MCHMEAELPQCEIWWGCKILKVRGKCPNVSQELRLSRFPPKTARQLYLIPISNNQNQNSNTTIITCWITSSLSVFDGVVKLALESSLEWKIWEENIKRVDLTVHDMKQSMESILCTYFGDVPRPPVGWFLSQEKPLKARLLSCHAPNDDDE